MPNLARASAVLSSKTSDLSSKGLNYTESSLKISPTSGIKEFFENDLKQRKHPLMLHWSEIEQAKYYEIEITRTRNCSRRYFKVLKNKLNIVVFPNVRYLWRVIAYSEKDILTKYSPKYKLYLKTPVGQHMTTRYEGPFPNNNNSRDIASSVEESLLCKYPTAEALNNLSAVANEDVLNQNEEKSATEIITVENNENTNRTPAYSYANKYSLWGRSWVKGGISFNGSIYRQEILENNEISHDTVTSPSYHGEIGTFFNSNFAMVLGANLSNSKFEDESGLINESYSSQKIELDGIYTLGSDWKTTKKSQWHLKFGFGYSASPVVKFSKANNSFSLVSAKNITARAGIGYKNKITDKFRPELGLSFAYPVVSSTSDEGVELDGGFLVDFNAGINYQLYNNYQIGIFWKTEITNQDYIQTDDAESISGSVLNINNHLGLFLGLEF